MVETYQLWQVNVYYHSILKEGQTYELNNGRKRLDTTMFVEAKNKLGIEPDRKVESGYEFSLKNIRRIVLEVGLPTGPLEKMVEELSKKVSS